MKASSRAVVRIKSNLKMVNAAADFILGRRVKGNQVSHEDISISR